jgi:hypothetical protein
MRNRLSILVALIAAILAGLASACAPSVVERTVEVEVPVEVEREVVVEVPAAEPEAEEAAPAEAEAPSGAEGAESPAIVKGSGGAMPARRERLIIKNGEMTLLVQDTDTTIDRLTQVVGDLGGYIISSRVWYQERLGDEYKYATVTLAVPAEEFEHALRRLRGLAIIVTDESASGQDVTDEFVDLESRLRNLQATRDRIREFLDRANTVEEALEVNKELAAVEDEIEQVQGRMNYLVDRASFSTITVHIEPDVPVLTPTPTPTPTVTPTPTATPTPTPWTASRTASRASNALRTTSRTLAQIVIWLVIAVLPWLAVLALLVWLAVFIAKRARRGLQRPIQHDEEQTPPSP